MENNLVVDKLTIYYCDNRYILSAQRDYDVVRIQAEIEAGITWQDKALNEVKNFTTLVPPPESLVKKIKANDYTQLRYIPKEPDRVVVENFADFNASMSKLSFEGEWILQLNIEKLLQDNRKRYEEAQVVKCINGVEFDWSLRGDEYALVKSKMMEAVHIDRAYIIVKGTDNVKYAATLPFLMFKYWFKIIDPVSTGNFGILTKNNATIQKCANLPYEEATNIIETELLPYINNTECNFNEFCDTLEKTLDNLKEQEQHITSLRDWLAEVKQPDGSYSIFSAV